MSDWEHAQINSNTILVGPQSSGWFYDFTSHIHAVRNPSLIIELLTYEAMKEKKDATVKVWALLRMILIEWIKWIEMTSYIPWDVVYIQTEIRH